MSETSQQPEESPPKFDFGWRQTWENREDDYICVVGNTRAIGRVYLSHMGRWEAFYQDGFGCSFRRQSRREAMLAIELEYERRAAGERASESGGFWMAEAQTEDE